MRLSKIWCGVLLSFLLLSPFGGDPGSNGQVLRLDVGPIPNTQNLQVNREFGRMPVYFIPNRGQMDEQVAYYVQGKDKTVYFTDEGITFALAKAKEKSEDLDIRKTARMARGMDDSGLIRLHSWEAKEEPYDGPEKLEKENARERWVVKLDFVGANPEAYPEGLEETGTKFSYFKGKPEEWKAGLPAYSKVIYRELWPGIDLVYYGTVNRMKYEFIVHPGASPSQIRLSYRGAESVTVDEQGRLHVKTPMGGFSDDVPVAYQEIGRERRNVEMAYRIGGGNSPGPDSDRKSDPLDQNNITATVIPLEANDAAREEEQETDSLPTDSKATAVSYGFEIGKYDSNLPLVLDPAILIYCGYIGGKYIDRGYGIAVDSAGCAYVTGATYSDEFTFPEIVGPRFAYSGKGDAFIAKVNSTGTALVYCGYIGGSGHDIGTGIAVDSAGFAYMTGYTNSSEATFPVVAGPDVTFNGDSDVFVAKINSSGTAIIYCGYIGGSDSDRTSKIAVDRAGFAYVTGATHSTEATFPVIVGPDLTFGGEDSPWSSPDAFVAKISIDGDALIYCGYIGGYGWDEGSGIAVDASGCAYITGIAGGGFPVIIGPGLNYGGGEGDAFAAKVNASGIALVYSGYIGGSDDDGGLAIALDEAGCAYVTGFTCSNEDTFPVTTGPDLTFNSKKTVEVITYDDAFIAKVSASGSALDYCGYIGGDSWEEGYGIAVDGAGCAYVLGYTGSSENTFPVTMGPDLTYNGHWDAFVTKVNAGGTALEYCGYIGGSSHESYLPLWGEGGIAVDGAGNSYVIGSTASDQSTFPVIVGPDLTFNGSIYDEDTFVAKISPEYFGYNVFDGHDFNGDGCSDIAAWRPSDGFWYIRGFDNDRWGQVNDIPVSGDYNGDGFTDLAVWRPSDGFWYIRGIDNDKLGQVGDVPVPKDYDGDGRTDLAVWRPSDGTWHIRYRAGGGKTKLWGQTGDFPVPGDYNGDGIADIAVWRPSNGLWYIKGVDTDRLGQDGDIPVPADYDGDGRTDLAVWRPSDGTWHIRYRAGGGKVKPWGMPGDVPIPGDYNGDGVADMAVWRPSTSQWLIRNIDTVRWGAPNDIPLVR